MIQFVAVEFIKPLKLGTEVLVHSSPYISAPQALEVIKSSAITEEALFGTGTYLSYVGDTEVTMERVAGEANPWMGGKCHRFVLAQRLRGDGAL